jgi:hypothetical protein
MQCGSYVHEVWEYNYLYRHDYYKYILYIDVYYEKKCGSGIFACERISV